jgi:hypothetical protein
MIEQVGHVMRSGTGFGVALEAERRRVVEGDALQGAVEQGLVCHAHSGRQTRLVHGKTVVLAGDQHAPGL